LCGIKAVSLLCPCKTGAAPASHRLRGSSIHFDGGKDRRRKYMMDGIIDNLKVIGSMVFVELEFFRKMMFMKNINKSTVIFCSLLCLSQNIFGQSPFSRGYEETINTYNNEYTRQQMFDILVLWLEEAAMTEVEKVQYDYTVYTQKDKQNYAWSISRGTSGYSNSGELFHWIRFSISNGWFDLYYPAKGTSLSNNPSFPVWSGYDFNLSIEQNDQIMKSWFSQAKNIVNDFINKSKQYLAIYNDNYGKTSLGQLTQWAETVVDRVGLTLMLQIFSE
jgi:hypothetical protein